jgi:hypothetical protein
MTSLRTAIEDADPQLYNWLDERTSIRLFSAQSALEEAVEQARRRSHLGQPRIRISHQPNMWPYQRLYEMFGALSDLADSDTQPVYFALDYDRVAAQRFARTAVWLNGHTAHTGLGRNVALTEEVAFEADPPTMDAVARTFAAVRKSRRQLWSKRRTPRLDILEEQHLRIASESVSAGDFATRSLAASLALTGDDRFEIRVGSAVLRSDSERLERRLGEVLELWREYLVAAAEAQRQLSELGYTTDRAFHLPSLDTLPVWWLCVCGRRLSLRWSGPVVASEECRHCGTSMTMSGPDLVGSGRWIPRIGAQHLFGIRPFAYDLGLVYGGSAEHTAVYSLAMAATGQDPYGCVIFSGSFSGQRRLLGIDGVPAHLPDEVVHGYLSHLVYPDTDDS